MSKKCNCGCGYPVFSTGYAKYCQHKRTDKKPSKLKRTPIKTKYKSSGEKALFLTIFDKNRDNWVSKLSGYPLLPPDHPWFYHQFAHVLSKAQNKYPKFKLFERNIWHMTPREHHLYDMGNEDQRKACALEFGTDWDILYKEKDRLIQLYNEKS